MRNFFKLQMAGGDMIDGWSPASLYGISRRPFVLT